jgi:hypothetical protein
MGWGLLLTLCHVKRVIMNLFVGADAAGDVADEPEVGCHDAEMTPASRQHIQSFFLRTGC